jgi:uncharacterized protein YcgI (DUF1989 family)
MHVPPRAGHSFVMETNQTVRIELPEGPQVVDVIAFHRDNTTERFSSSVTRQAFGSHLTEGDALLSVPPWERPLLEVRVDSLAGRVAPSGSGALPHDLLFGRCTRALRRRLYGEDSPGCHENLASAIRHYGLTEHDVHDPFNAFMTTGLDANGKLFFEPSIARPGDHLELLACVPCLVAVSTCPGASSGPVGHSIVLELG